MSTFDDLGTALSETPTDTNFLSPLIYRLQIRKTPNLNFFVQNVNLPGVHLTSVQQPNPFVTIPHTGDHLEFDEIMINFKIQENMADWLEIFNWLKALGFPNNYSEYGAINAIAEGTGLGVTSDISLIVMDSNRVPKHNIIFRDAFPVSLSSIIFDVAQADLKYVTAAATFKYTLYEYEALNV